MDPGSITRDCRPMQAQALVAYVAKDRLLAFPLSEVVRLIPLKASHSHKSHSGSRKPIPCFVQMFNLPSRIFLHCSHPDLNCPKIILPLLDHFLLPDRARSHHLMTFNCSSEQDFVFRCSTTQNEDNLRR